MLNIIIIFILGTAVGSFLNVLIDRLPKGEKITGRSHCDYCKRKLRWYDLIPVASFFILKRKCRYCKKKLSLQYPVIEMLTGAIFLLIFNFQTISLLAIICCLIVIFFSDLKYHLISDYILLALFVFSFFYHLTTNFNLSQLISIYFLSGIIVALPIFLIYFFSRERAMGLGDVYLTAIISFLLGWQMGFLALYIAFVTGAIVGLILIVLHRKKIKSRIAFGPFVVIGTIIMLFWGERIFEIIKKIYGF